MFDIKKSSKSHIDADEQFIVVRDAVVYLRILGREGEYTILTATAAEDSGGIVAFNDLEILINAALRVADKLNIRREVKYDHDQRPYAPSALQKAYLWSWTSINRTVHRCFGRVLRNCQSTHL